MKFTKKINNLFKLTDIIFGTSDRKNIIKLLFYMFFGMLLELFSVGLILPCMKVFTDQSFQNSIYNFLGISKLSQEILAFYILLIFITVFAFKNFFLWIVLKKYSTFIAKYEANLQLRIFNGYFNKSVFYFKQKNSSDIINNIIHITSFFSSIYLNAILLVSLELLMQIGLLAVLFYFSWQTTLLIFVLFGTTSLILYKINKKKLLELGEIRNKLSAEQLQNLQDGIGGIKEIKMLGRESFFSSKFEKSTNTLAEAAYRNAIIIGTPRLIVEFFAVISVSIIVSFFLISGKSIIEILPVLALFLAAAYKMVPSFNKILLMTNRIKFSSDTAKRIIPLLEEFKEFKSISKDKRIKNKINFNEEMMVKNIFYKYPNRDNQILKNTNLTIKKNTFIGISGVSGAGKSTLLDVIMGITIPDQGTVNIDGISIEKLKADWQNSIGYVSQNVFLIPNSIKRNIAFGLHDHEINNELIDNVIKKSALKNFVDSLKDNVDTEIGEGGAMISGGQKQRIGIARALYNSPKLLIFDEATSALDLQSEQEILNEIQILKKDTTLIFISHRDSALKNCDEKYILKDGILIKN